MSRSHSQNFTVTVRVALAQPDVAESLGPLLTEQALANPGESVDAAMDYGLPHDGDPEILRQAQRCLLAYIGWLLDEAPARYPSWAKDELQRAVRRLVEVEAATAKAKAKGAPPKLH
jgi:hypothetical protein